MQNPAKPVVDLRALSDEDLPSEEETGRKNNNGSHKRPRSLSKGQKAKGATEQLKPKRTKKRKVEQNPSPARPTQAVPSPRSAPPIYRPGVSISPASSPFSSGSGPSPSKLLLAISSLPNAKRISKLIGAESETSFDEWPNRLTVPLNMANIPQHRQRKYVLHFVSLWEELLASKEDETSGVFFDEDLQAIIKTHYPCDQRTILDQVLATFLLFHPENVECVLSALIELLSPAPTSFPPDSPLMAKGKKRVLSYNRKNLPFANLLGLFTACNDEEGGLYYRPDYKDDQGINNKLHTGKINKNPVENGGWSPSLLVCCEIVRFLIEKWYPDPSHKAEEVLHPSRKICAWLTDCLIEGPAVLREEHFKSLLAHIDRTPELLEHKKSPIVLLKELVFQEHNKYRTLTLAHSLLPLLLSRHEQFMRARKSFALSLKDSLWGAGHDERRGPTPHHHPSVVGYLRPFRAIIKVYFSQPSQVQSQQFLYQLLRSPPLSSPSASTGGGGGSVAESIEDTHVIFPLFNLLFSVFSQRPNTPKRKRKKQQEKSAVEDSYNAHSWFVNHFLDPILEILGGEDQVGVPQARRLLENVFFHRQYSSLLFGKDEEDYHTEEEDAVAKEDLNNTNTQQQQQQPSQLQVDAGGGDADGKGKEKVSELSLHKTRRKSVGSEMPSIDGSSGSAVSDAEERERLRLRMVSTLLDVMRNYGKEVQRIIMTIWEQSWSSSPNTLTPPRTQQSHQLGDSLPLAQLSPPTTKVVFSLRSPPPLDFGCLTATPSPPSATTTKGTTLSWERLKALLALYRMASPELQAMTQRVFLSFLHKTSSERKKEEEANNNITNSNNSNNKHSPSKHAQEIYQKILRFFIAEGKRGFAVLFIDFLEFITTEGPEMAAALKPHFARLFSILTVDALAIRTFDKCQPNTRHHHNGVGLAETPTRGQAPPALLSTLGVFPTAYRSEILASLLKAKPSASAFAHLKSPFKSRRLSAGPAAGGGGAATSGGGSGKGVIHHHSYLEACGDEPSKTKAAALLIIDTLKAMTEHSTITTTTTTTRHSQQQHPPIKQEASSMEVEEEEEVDSGVSVRVDRDFGPTMTQPQPASPQRVDKSAEEKNAAIAEYLRDILLSKSFLEYLFKALAASSDADSRALVVQILHLFVTASGTQVASFPSSSVDDVSMDIEEEGKKVKKEGGRDEVYLLGDSWKDERRLGVLLNLLADPFPQTADQAEKYLKILLGTPQHPQRQPQQPPFLDTLVCALWQRVAGFQEHEGEGRRLVSVLARIAYNWPHLRRGMAKKIDELLLVRGRTVGVPEVREHCWPNPCLLVLLRELNTLHGGVESRVVHVGLLSKAMLGILDNEKEVRLKQYELLASCLSEKITWKGGREEEVEAQLRFFVSQLPAVLQGVCSCFTEVRELCFMILRKGLDVPCVDVGAGKENEEKNAKEKKDSVEEEEEEDKEEEWKSVEEEALVAHTDDVDMKKSSTLGDYIAQLFEERLKMEVILSNDPTAIHYLQEAQRQLFV